MTGGERETLSVLTGYGRHIDEGTVVLTSRIEPSNVPLMMVSILVFEAVL